jgi:NAD(P)-dependent dehydrogenase (short-subunit alcohol dehydrogenase family)
MADLTGRVVAITGGARGIGLATARAFATAGARVALGDIDADLALRSARALDGAVDGMGAPLDVRDPESFAAFLKAVETDLGPVDVLVNNAGVAPFGMFTDLDLAVIDLLVDVNLRGVLHGTRLALPPMLARGHGHIVNVASLAGRIALPGAAVYTATKHAVVGLTETVRAEVRSSGVRLTAVLPTFVSTELVAGLPLRGVPVVAPERIAAAIVRAVRRGGPPIVTVPRWMGVLPRLAAVTPYRMLDALRGLMPRPVVDHAARTDYERRVSDLLG